MLTPPCLRSRPCTAFTGPASCLLDLGVTLQTTPDEHRTSHEEHRTSPVRCRVLRAASRRTADLPILAYCRDGAAEADQFAEGHPLTNWQSKGPNCVLPEVLFAAPYSLPPPWPRVTRGREVGMGVVKVFPCQVWTRGTHASLRREGPMGALEACPVGPYASTRPLGERPKMGRQLPTHSLLPFSLPSPNASRHGAYYQMVK